MMHQEEKKKGYLPQPFSAREKKAWNHNCSSNDHDLEKKPHFGGTENLKKKKK
jgi:hypothetical protein